jgi:protein gp37
MLGPIELSQTDTRVKWVIVGGESSQSLSQHPRIMQLEWAESLLKQCKTRGIPFFFKQWGDWVPSEFPIAASEQAAIRDKQYYRVGNHRSGRLLGGVEVMEFPRSNNA